MNTQHSRLIAKSSLLAQLTGHRMQSTRAIMISLAVCMALQMTSFVMIIPLFARRFSDFGAGVEALSLSAMAYALASTLAAPFMGALADRFGRRPMVLVSLAVDVLAFSGYLFASSAPIFIVLRTLAGAFTAGLVPAVTGIVADLAPQDRRAQWIGIVSGGASFGWIAGPLLGGLLYDRWNYIIPFTIAIVMAVIALAAAFLFVPETRQQSLPVKVVRDRQNFRMKDVAASFKSCSDTLPRSLSTFFVLLFISFMVMFAWAFIEPQFMFYAYDELGWTSSQLGLTMSTYGVALMIGEFALGRLSDRLGRKPVLVLGLALFSAQFIGLAFSRDVAWIILSFTLAGLGNALFDPALSAHILDVTPSAHKASMMGIKNTVSSFGNMLGPATLVFFSTYFSSPQGIFKVAAVLVLLLAGASGLVFKASHSAGS